MGKLKIEGYELRDIAIVQAPVSFANHRGEVDPFVEICERKVYPIFVAPMASVTDQNNYKVWIDNQLTPVLPRSVQKSDENPDGLDFVQRMISLRDSISRKESYDSRFLKENLQYIHDNLKLVQKYLKK